ncbi:MAG: hypothetical protein WCG98_02120 [bacterium]
MKEEKTLPEYQKWFLEERRSYCAVLIIALWSVALAVVFFVVAISFHGTVIGNIACVIGIIFAIWAIITRLYLETKKFPKPEEEAEGFSWQREREIKTLQIGQTAQSLTGGYPRLYQKICKVMAGKVVDVIGQRKTIDLLTDKIRWVKTQPRSIWGYIRSPKKA